MATPAFNPTQDYQAAPPAFDPNAEYAAAQPQGPPADRLPKSWRETTPSDEEQEFLRSNPNYAWLPADNNFPNRRPGIYPTGPGNEWRNDPVLNERKGNIDQTPVDLHLARHSYQGAKAGAMAATAPLAMEASVPQIIGGVIGGTAGSVAGSKIAQSAGAGEVGQEVAGDVGGLIGGITGGGASEWTAGKIAKAKSVYDSLPSELKQEFLGMLSPGVRDRMLSASRLKTGIEKLSQSATPTPEELNPALVSPARTLPGQVGPERIFGPRPTPAQPIPSRAGLALTGEVAAPAVAQPGAAGSMVESVAAPEPAAAPKPISKAALGRQLDQALPESLGVEPAKPLQPNVSLKNQIKAEVQAQAPLPDGFTRVKSDALRGYKYDPEAREFESITNDGQHYVHGDVPPEAVEKFEAADSKGRAWKTLRETPGVVRTAKVVNGQRVAATPPASIRSIVIDPETGQPEFSDVVAAKKAQAQTTQAAAPNAAATSAPKTTAAKPPVSTAAGEGDLLSQLQASVDQVKAKPGGVFTSAAPKDLLTRWGVDPESFTEGRSQTRGMSPGETEASIKKLTAAYKKGQPVEPVLETRDADNNLVDVDGRGRALAAHRAGVERIPVIVRRLAPASSQ